MKQPPSNELPLLDRISDFARFHAGRAPDAEALILGERRMTYQALADAVDELARALLAAGVRKGDRVATLCTPHPDYFVIFLAASSIGAIWLGLNPNYRLDEYRYILGDSEPTILFARTRIGGRDYRDDLQTLRREVASLRALVILGDDPACDGAERMTEFLARSSQVAQARLATARNAVQPLDPALIVYTSGSTGRPKGALLPHRGLVRCSIKQVEYWNCTPLRLLNYLPINHIGCVGDFSCFALVAGGAMVFQEKFEPAEALAIVERERLTWLGGVPTALQMMIAADQKVQHDLSAVQIVMWSGAAAPRSLVEQLLARFPLATSSYGLTETVGSVTFAGPCRDVALLADTIGFPVPDYEMRIVRPDGAVARPGEEGEIQVRGDFIMSGYWRKPEATAETFDADGFFRSGDLALELPDGSYRLVGRLKEMFISGGYNVFPREIEQVIEQHPAIAMAAVIPASDALYGEVGIAFAMLEPGKQVGSEELDAHCRRKLANYKVPKQFHIATELPMLPIGKIDKRALKQRVAGPAAGT